MSVLRWRWLSLSQNTTTLCLRQCPWCSFTTARWVSYRKYFLFLLDFWSGYLLCVIFKSWRTDIDRTTASATAAARTCQNNNDITNHVGLPVLQITKRLAKCIIYYTNVLCSSAAHREGGGSIRWMWKLRWWVSFINHFTPLPPTSYFLKLCTVGISVRKWVAAKRLIMVYRE